MAIATIDDLRAHVALATKVELSTIPPYLYAFYSIKDPESEAARLIASVVVEEMLHACLTANLSAALGGDPHFGYEMIPSYPSPLAHHQPELVLELKRCTPELVQETFLTIEKPQAPGAIPEDDNFETLGQFYAALELAIDALSDDMDLFDNHQPARQLSDPAFYGPVTYNAADAGGLMLIQDRASADEALEIIIHQGEGVSDQRWADPDHQELTHYYKYLKIADGASPIGPVWPVPDNPRTEDFPNRLRKVSELFNALYGLVYVTMNDLYSGTQDQGEAIGRLYKLMRFGVSPTARYLVSQPIGPDSTAGPTFETHRFGADPWGETAELAETVVAEHPELDEVAQNVTSGH
jgi:hypothetical protein